MKTSKSLFSLICQNNVDVLNMINVFFDKQIFKFTNTVFTDSNNGDEYYIVKLLNGSYRLLKMFVDVDCDGTFYHAYFYNVLPIKEYSVDTIWENSLPLLFNHLRIVSKE